MSAARVNVLTGVDDPAVFNYPLAVHRPALAARGWDVRFHYRLGSAVLEGEVLFISSKFFKPYFAGRRGEVFAFLEKAKAGGRRVVWFDTTDGTGSTQFEVLPFVDAYGKTQLLRDRALYEKNFMGGRVFSDFYHRRFGVSDADGYAPAPLRPEHAHKLFVSWNSGLGAGWAREPQPAGAYHKLYRFLFRRAPGIVSWLPMPLRPGTVDFADPSTHREFPVSGRVQVQYDRATVRFQREKVKERLSARRFPVERVGKGQYLRELRRSRVAVSPFGWGEICWRDWEIIMAGAALLKPHMDHLETWPDLFAPDKTYAPFRWDLSDFDARLDSLLADPASAGALAASAQAAYRRSIGQDGRREFVERVVSVLEKK